MIILEKNERREVVTQSSARVRVSVINTFDCDSRELSRIPTPIRKLVF